MSHRAWAYIWGVLVAGLALSGLAGTLTLPALSASSSSAWMTFVVLTLLATLSQLFEAEAPGRYSYYPHWVFFFVGVVLLYPYPFLFVLMVAIPHLVEWAKARMSNSPHLKAWYIQPFNIATHIIAGLAASWAYRAFDSGSVTFTALSPILAATTAALTYVFINHLLIGLALVLARSISWEESGVWKMENLLPEIVMSYMGYVVAVLWELNPWYIIPALSPLVLIYRALMVPQLKKDAQTDEKTGLWNARHFTRLFTEELTRARRFNRPLTVIMADLDLLRNINNTYGHLAGDAVLAGIGQIIRQNIREFDIAGRFGGEEFAIVLPETGPVEAMALAERLRAAVEAVTFDAETSAAPIHATMSVGVACCPWDACTLNELIHEADLAVYQAKLQGRNCVIAASDVPRFIKLQQMPVADRVESTYSVAFTPRVLPAETIRAEVEAAALAVAAAPPLEQEQLATIALPRASRNPWFWLFVSGVVLGGAITTLGSLFLYGYPHSNLPALGLLIVLAVVAELLHVDLYGRGTFSVSVGVIFATALIAGVPGVACVSAAISLVHYARRRPAPYKTAFNWATHVLAGLAPVLAISLVPVALETSNLLLLAVPTILAALIYYVVETGLIATAISLAEGSSVMLTWHERSRWQASHYFVLCGMGLFLGVAYTAQGPLGLVVFMLPVLMMRYAQKQYVEKTQDSVQELKRMNHELTLANREVVTASKAMQQLNEELLLTLSKIIDARDPYVSNHAAKVADYATAIALEIGITPDRIEPLRQAGFLHDIGKIAISEQVLHKPDRLTDEEYRYVKTHAALGGEFLEMCRGLRHLAPLVRHHHEWWDGSGYPDRLKAEAIPLEARILAVCDAVEAMASDRPYRKGMSLPKIIAEIKRCAGTQFDPVVAEAFIRVAEREQDHLVVNAATSLRRPLDPLEPAPALSPNGTTLGKERLVAV